MDRLRVEHHVLVGLGQDLQITATVQNSDRILIRAWNVKATSLEQFKGNKWM